MLCRTYHGDKKYIKIYKGNLEGREYLGELSVDGRII
jgi:hypothetical protein